MGFSRSCRIFQVVTKSVQLGIARLFYASYRIVPNMKVYIDDFMGGEYLLLIATLVFRFVKRWLWLVGLPTKDSKDRPPFWKNMLLGREFNTRTECKLVRTEKKKCDKYLHYLDKILVDGDLSLKMIRKVHGQFNYCSAIIP